MHRMNLTFLCIALLVTWADLSAAQRVITPQPNGRAQTQPGQRWALIIGINDYADDVGDLRYAVADANALYRTLTAIPDGFPAKNILLMTDETPNPNLRPTRSNLLAQLATWLGLAGPDDTVLIYLATHGIEQNGKSYILPQDARMAQLGLTSIELEYIKEALRQSKARNKVLIVDACHSGAGRAPQPMGDAMAQALSRASAGMVMLASCDVQERSYEMDDKGHGVYTYFLMEALQGAADRDGDGLLSTYEVNLYAWDNTRRWAAARGLSQTPKYVTAISGDIVLGRVIRSTSAPIPVLDSSPVSDALSGVEPASSGDFSLDDLKKEAEREKSSEAARVKEEAHIQAQWNTRLQEMEQAFVITQEFVKGNMSSQLKHDAWQKFTEAYKVNNPYSSRDEELLQHARELMEYWERYEYTNSIGMRFVLIPLGEFMMGAQDGEHDGMRPQTIGQPPSEEGNANQKPVHRVRISKPFYMGIYEVTQGQWEAVMGATGQQQQDKTEPLLNLRVVGPNHPMHHVSWEDCQEFIRRLDRMEGVGESYRLPTEAEWEYACRAGTTGEFGGSLDALGWYVLNSSVTIHPVGQKQPNDFGLYDMHGNVSEWCADRYEAGYYKNSPMVDPVGPTSGSNRIIRGGSYWNLRSHCRSAYRFYVSPDNRSSTLGFRLVRTVKPSFRNALDEAIYRAQQEKVPF